MGASLGRAGSLPVPMSEKRRRAIAAADREDARYGTPDTRPRDADTDSGSCPHNLPGCRCDGAAHATYWGRPR